MECKRVLIADDNVDAADSLAMLLSSLGCACRVAYDGAQALAEIEHELPDVVILDLFMPRISGYEVARALRGVPHGEEVLLVAHTAMNSRLHLQAMREAGFDHHMVKPAPTGELLSLVLGSVPAPRLDAPAPQALAGR